MVNKKEKGFEDAILKKSLKLNHPCCYCSKEIFIGDGGIIEGKPYHDLCFRKECAEKTKQEILKEIDECDFVRGCLNGKGCAEELKQKIIGGDGE